MLPAPVVGRDERDYDEYDDDEKRGLTGDDTISEDEDWVEAVENGEAVKMSQHCLCARSRCSALPHYFSRD